MATKKLNEAKYTIWTKTMRLEGSGSIEMCTEQFFIVLPNAEARVKMLARLQHQHERCIEWEATRVAKTLSQAAIDVEAPGLNGF